MESHVVTLARSVAHLSSEMRTQHLMIQVRKLFEKITVRNELKFPRLYYYQVFAGNGEHKMRDCDPQNANEHGDGQVTVATSDQGFRTTSALQSFEGEEADQVLRHGATSHQIISEGTWV